MRKPAYRQAGLREKKELIVTTCFEVAELIQELTWREKERLSHPKLHWASYCLIIFALAALLPEMTRIK